MSNPKTRPPNNPGPPPGAGRPPIITGGMTVEITIGEVSITITGPLPKVVAVLRWLFGSEDSSTVIARLQLVFGPEQVVMRKS